MGELDTSDAHVVMAQHLDGENAKRARWSVYVARVSPSAGPTVSAIKIGMVSTSAVRSRIRRYETVGAVDLLDVWSLEHAARLLVAPAARTLTMQLERRLQFAAEHSFPNLRVRQAEPATGFYSIEWFIDDDRLLSEIRAAAARPLLLPFGIELASVEQDHGPGLGQKAQAGRTPEERSASARKAQSQRTAQQRSDAARKARITMTTEAAKRRLLQSADGGLHPGVDPLA